MNQRATARPRRRRSASRRPDVVNATEVCVRRTCGHSSLSMSTRCTAGRDATSFGSVSWFVIQNRSCGLIGVPRTRCSARARARHARRGCGRGLILGHLPPVELGIAGFRPSARRAFAATRFPRSCKARRRRRDRTTRSCGHVVSHSAHACDGHLLTERQANAEMPPKAAGPDGIVLHDRLAVSAAHSSSRARSSADGIADHHDAKGARFRYRAVEAHHLVRELGG